MRIRKLELQGFKSFADRAAFHFGAGISGVVGPNGCGKSNVVDGVKWCLGEQRARTLRGDAMTDVIFAGSAGRKGVSFAEVSLTFTADDEPFPGIWERFPEIDVTRRLYRDGTSEYLINQEKVRLRDVNELFMDSGAANQLYSFIEQGRIGQIVQAHPEQRRTLIEEAAGISRYKARREETLQKLTSTRSSLERVADLTDEMGRQLKSAERAVLRALRWQELSCRVRQEEIAVGLARCHGLIGDRKAVGQAVREAQAAMEQATRGVEGHEADVAARRAVLEASEAELGEVRDAMAKAEADRRVEDSGQQFQQREAASARDRLGQLERDVAGQESERDAARVEVERAEAAWRGAEAQVPALRLRADALGEESRSLGFEVSHARAALDAARKVALAALEAAVRARSVREGMDRRGRDLDERARRHAERVEEARSQDSRVADEITRVQEQVALARAAVEGAKAVVAGLLADAQGAEREREAAVGRVRSAEQGVREAEREVTRVQEGVRGAEDRVRKASVGVQAREAEVRGREQAWTAVDRERAALLARIDAIEDGIRRNTDAPDGLKQALAVPGVLGLLAPMLEVPREREELLARMLEGGLETVLVPDVATALAVARAAKGQKARVLIVGPDRPTAGARGIEGIGGTPLGREALARLAPNVVEVDSVERAYAAWAPGLRVVSRDGAVLREDGVLLLGLGAAGTAAFARKREVAALREDLEKRAAAVKAAAGEVAAARGRVAEAEAERDALSRAVREELGGVAVAQQGVEAARAFVREQQNGVAAADAAVRKAAGVVDAARQEQRRVETIEHEVRARLDARQASRVAAERLAQQLVADGLAVERARVELTREDEAAAVAILAAEAKQVAAEEEVRTALRKIELAEPRLQEAQAEIASTRMALSELQGTVRNEGALADAARARVERATLRIQQVGQERSRLETRLVELALEAEAAAARLQALGEQIGVLRDRMDDLKGRVGESRDAVKVADTAARAARDRRDVARDALGAAEARLARVRDALERLRGEVEGKHEVNLVGLLDRLVRDGQLLIDGWESVGVPELTVPESVPTMRLVRSDLDRDVEERARGLAELRTTFGKIGEVNVGALDEFLEVSGRHGELVRQRADLEEAMRIIEDVIGQLNRTCRERFRETFDLVAEHFVELYPRLVGGGSGRLALTNEDDLLLTGVEMYVQPPGKKVQSLSLLSGGEKAMAAIALIFSLFRVKPSPFCLLDEVDAPLDEGNGERFNQMLKEMSQRSQFIIITHNKKTMECADVLYGVSMPEPGISRLVTVKLD